MYGWLFNCHGFWHNIGLIVPSALFVLYLAFQAKKSFVKLSSGRSYIIIAYYWFLWLVSLLNLAWCLLQGDSNNFALVRESTVSDPVKGKVTVIFKSSCITLIYAEKRDNETRSKTKVQIFRCEEREKDRKSKREKDLKVEERDRKVEEREGPEVEEREGPNPEFNQYREDQETEKG